MCDFDEELTRALSTGGLVLLTAGERRDASAAVRSLHGLGFEGRPLVFQDGPLLGRRVREVCLAEALADPVARSAGGVLALTDVAALPESVQYELLELIEHRPPSARVVMTALHNDAALGVDRIIAPLLRRAYAVNVPAGYDGRRREASTD